MAQPSLYFRLASVCLLRILFSSPRVVHSGTVAVRPGLGRRSNAAVEIRV